MTQNEQKEGGLLKGGTVLLRTIFAIQDEPPTWPGADDDEMGLESISSPEEECVNADEQERERQRNVAVSSRVPAQGRNEGQRMHTARARDGSAVSTQVSTCFPPPPHLHNLHQLTPIQKSPTAALPLLYVSAPLLIPLPLLLDLFSATFLRALLPVTFSSVPMA
ncbi:hypothetical protein C8J57DRAFT_1546039 [Mycena rebaudengoi]|nr:hypothetical protein C8J57DRAFT_1546039 [Mycena rebaudengoi]